MQQAHLILVGSGGQPYRDWDGTEPWAEEVHAQVTAAHTALGVEAGVTHAEVRLTSRGPRLVELNGRLGGDLIPYAGQLATGVDLVRAAPAVALRERPDLTPTRALTTEVRFLYPPHDGRIAAVSVEPGGRHRRRRALLRRGRRRQPRRRPPADRRCAAAAPGHPSSARCCGSSAT
ncbi:hypothetical protein [Streptomyces albidoflavus]|uniref:hypothetical protein n=1 Tax=Streptomyces albidoflavus TaxID=1886 RepID=UPI0020D1423C|nr:hypothetical protein [Streptomyces albidoflavus]